MHLVGSVIRIYHDARPPERQNEFLVYVCSLFCYDIHLMGVTGTYLSQ